MNRVMTVGVPRQPWIHCPVYNICKPYSSLWTFEIDDATLQYSHYITMYIVYTRALLLLMYNCSLH